MSQDTQDRLSAETDCSGAASDRSAHHAVSGAGSDYLRCPTKERHMTLSLDDYLDAGRSGRRACFNCRRVAMPMPVSASEEESGPRELHCGLCQAAAAVPVEQAAREGWLDVVHDGRVLNDRERAS